MKTSLLFILIIPILFFAQKSHSQFVKPTGTTGASSQLVYYYDNTGESIVDEIASYIQVTNDHDTQSVWIHVQIFRNFLDGNTLVSCDERDFVDLLTPNDTHTYYLNHSFVFPKNMGETETQQGEATNIDADNTKGFVIITPVVSEADLSAISFQHLTGKSYFAAEFDQGTGFPAVRYQVEAMGRDALDFTTGEILPDNTPLDGVSGGYVVLQPEELLFEFAYSGPDSLSEPTLGVDIVGIAFSDVYGEAGLLGYQALAADANWTSFLFDFKEDPTSCGNRTVDCFLTLGLNDDIPQNNTDLVVSGEEDLLCPGAGTPEYPTDEVNFDSAFSRFGWARIFVSGLDDFENHLGFFVNAWIDGAGLIYTKGAETEVTPPAPDEICNNEIDDDGDGLIDCADSDCDLDAACETGEDVCSDGLDNDGDDKIDCLDEGCNGFSGCEFGEELSCNDGVDNDGDEATDGNDSDCQTSDTGGGGGGCVVASSVVSTTATANMLLPLLSLAGAYLTRRMRRRE